MAALRFSCFAGSLLVLASAVPAWSQSPESGPPKGSPRKGEIVQSENSVGIVVGDGLFPDCCSDCWVAVSPIRKTYSLAEICDDPTFGAWVAEMIPQVVQPGTWNKGAAPNRRVLSYFAPAKMLLVYHTPAAHAEIDDFLRGMKKSLPTTKATAKAPALFGLAQTNYSVPEVRTESAPVSIGYPVATPAHQPHHLFHFIIRYEGDGIIDQNVAEFAKAYGGGMLSTVDNTNAPAPASPRSEAPVKGVTPACSSAAAPTPAPVSCNMPAECPPNESVPLPSACGAPRSTIITVRPHVPNSSSPRSEPTTVRPTPAPAPNYPAPVTPPATPDVDDKE
jgi:hypothetical protein